MRSNFFPLIFIFAFCWSTIAMADSCPPLTAVAHLPITYGEDNRVYVPAKVNGLEKSFLVDTGGAFMQIRSDVVAQLKLDSRQVPLELIGVEGQISQRASTAQLELGTVVSHQMDFMIMPDPRALASDIPDAGGVLAPNLLAHFDADFDFGNKKLNLISQQHCDGRVVYWADAAVVIPFRFSPSRDIVFPITLDGHSFLAILDTGSNTSFMNLTMAEDMGLSPDSPDMIKAGTMSDRDHTAYYRHTFKSLQLQGMTISNATIEILPNLMLQHDQDYNSNYGGTMIHSQTYMPDVTIGMDVLRKLHVYVAYKEQKLYITAAERQPAPASGK
jgi:predicted aspartyl protease